MTEQEKHERWRKIAFSMAEDKRNFLAEPFEKAEKKNGNPIRKTKSLRV